MIHKIYWLVVCLLLFVNNAASQNLVPNYSFEEYWFCPIQDTDLDFCNFWLSFCRTPDYYNSCSTDSIGLEVSTPSNYVGYQIPSTGGAYVSLTTYSDPVSNYREFVAVELTTPLENGFTYKAQFKTSLADVSQYATRIGIHMSKIYYEAYTPLPLDNYFHVISDSIIVDTSGWTIVSGEFIADDNYKYLVIGNFFNDDNIDFKKPYPNASIKVAHYYVDDVSLEYVPLRILGDTSICFGDSLVLSAINDKFIGWMSSLNHGIIFSSERDITISPTITTTYIAYGVIDTVEITVTVNDIPAIDLGEDKILCEGDSVLISAFGNGFVFNWNDNSTSQTSIVSQPATYWVQATLENGCTSIDSITISGDSIPSVHLGNDTVLCQNESITLTAANHDATYVWNTSSTDDTFTVEQQGDYFVKVTNYCGSVTDTIHVSFTPLPIFSLGNDTIICSGDMLFLDVTRPNASYEWVGGSTNPIYTILSDGIFWAKVTVDNCSFIDSVEIGIDSIPSVGFGEDTTICRGNELILFVKTTNVQYLWQDNSTDQHFTVREEGNYSVSVTNNCGTAYDEMLVTTDRCYCALFVPEAFTPNQDGLNDVFSSKSNCSFDEYWLAIYDRWGEKIFETDAIDKGWNGRTVSSYAPNGVYVYIIKYKFTESDIKIESGCFSLIK